MITQYNKEIKWEKKFEYLVTRNIGFVYNFRSMHRTDMFCSISHCNIMTKLMRYVGPLPKRYMYSIGDGFRAVAE